MFMDWNGSAGRRPEAEGGRRQRIVGYDNPASAARSVLARGQAACQESRRVTMRFRTGASGRESLLSTVK
ncbi:Uncharacterised protein [Bordetella pertussis]|nr:Uncharacterised protein [Bordetella pertussis]